MAGNASGLLFLLLIKEGAPPFASLCNGTISLVCHVPVYVNLNEQYVIYICISGTQFINFIVLRFLIIDWRSKFTHNKYTCNVCRIGVSYCLLVVARI